MASDNSSDYDAPTGDDDVELALIPGDTPLIVDEAAFREAEEDCARDERYEEAVRLEYKQDNDEERDYDPVQAQRLAARQPGVTYQGRRSHPTVRPLDSAGTAFLVDATVLSRTGTLHVRACTAYADDPARRDNEEIRIANALILDAEQFATRLAASPQYFSFASNGALEQPLHAAHWRVLCRRDSPCAQYVEAAMERAHIDATEHGGNSAVFDIFAVPTPIVAYLAGAAASAVAEGAGGWVTMPMWALLAAPPPALRAAGVMK